MIPLDQLEAMFANMRAQTPWNVHGDLLWGYFFFDRDKTKLQQLAAKLVGARYRFVCIYPTDDGATNVLHVERVETHSPYTLFIRNGELEQLAREFEIECYDGMDVGLAESLRREK